METKPKLHIFVLFVSHMLVSLYLFVDCKNYLSSSVVLKEEDPRNTISGCLSTIPRTSVVFSL